MTTDDIRSGVSIVESYNDYSPSFNVVRLVRQMLTGAPPKFLVGLRSVVLTNRQSLSSADRKRKTVSRGRRVILSESLGFYTQEWKGQPARITLLMDNIERQWPGLWFRIGFVRAAVLSDIFFHELGHHIHRAHQPLYEEREAVANRWSKKLSGRFLARKYWYLLPIAAPMALARDIWRDFASIIRQVQKKT